uniref:HDC03319 n=1 Tax=Drosophila melanogaster TaxID=7227 RepID=Q6IH52_DROME|nr:TPA_inf: HDC03319 [Drosophila melanogaster]
MSTGSSINTNINLNDDDEDDDDDDDDRATDYNAADVDDYGVMAQSSHPHEQPPPVTLHGMAISHPSASASDSESESAAAFWGFHFRLFSIKYSPEI